MGPAADEWMMSNQPLIATHAPSQGQAEGPDEAGCYAAGHILPQAMLLCRSNPFLGDVESPSPPMPHRGNLRSVPSPASILLMPLWKRRNESRSG